MAIHKIIDSFNAGELSPLMDSRLGVEKTASGCRILRNFIPHTIGPVFRRGGMEYRAAARSHTKRSCLRPFNFSTSTSAILEFSPLGFRVLQNGAVVPLVADVPFPYSEQACFEIQTTQINDLVYLAHESRHPHKLIRLANNRWVLDHLFRGLIEVGTAAAVDTTAGALGKVRLDYYLSFPVSGDVDGMIAEPVLSNPPDGGQDITDLSPPLVPAATNYMRKITGNLSVPTTGNWVLTLPANARARLYVNGVSTLTVEQGGVESSATLPLEVGVEYALVIYNWLNSGSQDFKLSIAGPSFAKQVVPGSMLSKVDASGGSYNPADFGNAWPPMLDINVTPTTVAVSAIAGTGATATATEPIFKPGHVGSFWQIAHTRANASEEVVGAVGAFSGTSAALPVLGPWNLYTYGTWSGTLSLQRLAADGATWETLQSWSGNKDRNVIAEGVEDNSSQLRLVVTGANGEAASGAAVPRFLLEAADARLYGLIYITAVANDGLTATCDVKRDLFSTAATGLWAEGAWSEERGYPRASTLHKGSMYYGGTRSFPSRLWKSAAGDWENFRITSLADGAMDITLAAEESNTINWLSSVGLSLLIGTAGEEWSLAPSNGEIISPLTISVERQSRFGSAYLPAVVVNDVPVFLQRGGRRIRKMIYNDASRQYSASDMTALAEHITAGKVVQMAFQSHASSILWAVTGTGGLIGMTHETEQNVFAWHRHDTDGEVESCAVIYGNSGAGSDELWMVVRRTAEDGSDRRFIERMDLTVMGRDFSEPANLNYLDCSRHHIFSTPGVFVPDLEHLEGLELDVLVDGAAHPKRSVIDGAITLQAAGTHVIAGLGFESVLQPMKQELPMNDGTAQGRKAKVAKCTVRYFESLGGQVADNASGPLWEPICTRTSPAAMDAAPSLETGERNCTLESRHRNSVDITVRQTQPLPLNVIAIVAECDIYQST